MGVLADEMVSIQRTGWSYPTLVDPLESRLYFPVWADVQAGDVAGFRGYTRRISTMPAVWNGAGVVAELEDAPTFLPDLGRILRPSSEPGVPDPDTGIIAPPDAVLVWSGPCNVAATQSDGTVVDIGEQRLGRVPFLVTVPLAVTDINVGDIFDVTQSRDGLLVTRNLVVSGFRMSSTSTTRDLLAFDSQE